MKRYIVEEGSDSGHCCFQWSVIDLSVIEEISGDGLKLWHKVICECFEEEDAENICNLLNKSVDSVAHP